MASKPLVLASLCLGQFMIQLDITIVNVALPAIGRDLHSSLSGLQWVLDGYSLALASLLLTGGRIGDRAGHRRCYLAGLVLFGIASALCAAAPSAGLLICFRILQGVGGAIQLPATLAILTHTFTSPRERAQAVGIWTSAAGSALIIGPVLGGALIAALGWRAVFVINLPIALVAVALARTQITDSTAPAGGTLDLRGQALATAALGLLAAGAIEGGQRGFTGALPVGLLIGGVACLAGFLTTELHAKSPMLPLRFFRSAAYAAGNLSALVMGFVNVGLLFILTLFFQQVQGHSAIAAGLRFVPYSASFVLSGPLIGRAISRVGHRLPMSTGCLLLAAGCLLLTGLDTHSGYGAVAWRLVIIGVGYGLLSTPMAAVVLSSVPAARAGMASSTNLTGRVTGGLFGIAVLGALMRSSSHQITVAGLHTASIIAAAVALAGATATAAFID